MHGEQQQLDSYQNPIDVPRENQSVEAIGTPDDREGVESPVEDGYRDTAANYATDARWDSDEDAERLASSVVAGQKHDQHDSAQDDAVGGGRAAGSEDFEDEMDDSLFFPRP